MCFNAIHCLKYLIVIPYLPDMHVLARGPDLAQYIIQPEGVGIHIRQITRARDTTDMYHAG